MVVVRGILMIMRITRIVMIMIVIIVIIVMILIVVIIMIIIVIIMIIIVSTPGSREAFRKTHTSITSTSEAYKQGRIKKQKVQ